MSQLAWLCFSGSKRTHGRPQLSTNPISAYRPYDSTLMRHFTYLSKFDRRLASTPSAWYSGKCCCFLAYLVWPDRLNSLSLIIYFTRRCLCLWRVEYYSQCRHIAISWSRLFSIWADHWCWWIPPSDSVYKQETQASQSTCHRRQALNCWVS